MEPGLHTHYYSTDFAVIETNNEQDRQQNSKSGTTKRRGLSIKLTSWDNPRVSDEHNGGARK